MVIAGLKLLTDFILPVWNSKGLPKGLHFTLPHFFGDRPGVAALSVQVLDDVFVALFVAVALRPAGRRILEGI